MSLVATPESGSLFVGWGGSADCADGDPTMTDDRSCTATFEVDPSTMIFADGFESGDLSMWAPRWMPTGTTITRVELGVEGKESKDPIRAWEGSPDLLTSSRQATQNE